jgi:magnesium-protoporphyrin O-methyltransferase
VVCSCCECDSAVDRQFTATKAAKELQSYRNRRLEPTARLLRDSVVETGLNHGSLLDIGGGIGALTFELLERGMSEAVIADAAAAYVTAATDEANRRGSRVHVVRGDFLQVSGTLPSANLVTLDRVVCCYQAYQPLLVEALKHAVLGCALSYPRDRWYVRAGIWLDNARRARRSGFRAFVHPPRRIQDIIQQAGFVLARRRFTFVWTVDVYVRNSMESRGGPATVVGGPP